MNTTTSQPSIRELLKRVKLPLPEEIAVEVTCEGKWVPATPEQKQRARAERERLQRLLDLANKERPDETPLTFDDYREEHEIFDEGSGVSTSEPLPPEVVAASIAAREKYRAWLIKLDQEQNGDR